MNKVPERRRVNLEESVVNQIHAQLSSIHEKLETLTRLDVRQQDALATIYEIKGDLRELDRKYEELAMQVSRNEGTMGSNSKLIWALLSAVLAGGGVAFTFTDFI